MFLPGETKTAIVTMKNPTGGPFDYLAELYMGTNLALMASASFHLEAGESKDISLPVTMPSVAGTYPVYVGVFSGGESIGLYKAVEDVVISAPVLPPFYMPLAMDVVVTDGVILDMYWKCKFSVVITNIGDAIGTYTIRGQDNLASQWGGPRYWGPQQITLAPGETYRWSLWYYIDFRRVSVPYAWELFGDWEQDNYSKGEARP